MKKVKQENTLLADLKKIEMENINGGGWKDTVRSAADFGRELISFPYGCGMGDGYTKGSTYTSGGGNYLSGAYGHRN
ncbi:hypothetical protein [Bacillus sp. CDB3]|uniref:hypothetical protein n=1 Tax=Bacillus sp. CDB3 TaxID=360310 RepID=UPI0009D88658|nr:hypothetical protein [Bacillus sp. CDB3]OQR53508.1 hypothetical protein CDB3_29250 [Bacillus sp. CDB3]